jgi:hypothetical protein
MLVKAHWWKAHNANLHQDKPSAGIWGGSYGYNSQNIRWLAFEVKVY